MPDQPEARRARLMDLIADSEEPLDLETLAEALHCDTRTIRRDVDQLQHWVERVQGLEIRRGRVLASRARFSPGYFTDQLERNQETKEAIARAVLADLPDNTALALTAGTTPYAVARALRRAVAAGEPPHDLIVFTNSLPALLELISAGIQTGVLGEIYTPEDCAFHSPEIQCAFRPSIAVVGASGIQIDPESGLDLFSHRAEEAAFLKQFLATVPEIVIVADSSKLGRLHPWSFGGPTLAGKTIRLVTDVLTDTQRERLDRLTERVARSGATLSYVVSCT